MNANIVIAPIVMGIGGLASLLFRLPLGMETEFQFFLAPLASFFGYGCAHFLRKTIKHISIICIVAVSLVLVLLAVVDLWLYNHMLFSIPTPSSWQLVLEGTLFSLMFYLFFFGAGFAQIKAFNSE